ncbi:Protein FAM189B [Heterocephalus glaber]|uniref:Protein FAM189B n=1 Tax=Heterocephalus glaber TaxID=10181 RepID=G5BDF6_HETGA|nr:Protein FAM189B [Heterocephalus glaber]
MMPSPSDSIRSLTSRPSTRGLTHLRLHRPWLQALLTLGLAQVLLGILVVTFSMVASSVTTTESIKRSCPSWAGFSLAFSGVVGIVSWKRPFTLVISFFSLLSVLCVMLSMAGSVLSCKNAQLARDFRQCTMEGKACVCCPPVPLPRPCPEPGRELKIAPNSTCDEARGALKNLLFSVCGLTVCAAVICTLSAIVCCIQIFSLDLVHTQLVPERSVSGPLGLPSCAASPPAPLLHTMLDLEEFVPPVPPPPYYPPEYTCSSETDAQSITYNGSMDSPVPLYPTDCPPSYEAVMGLRGDSQATLFDPQLHDGACMCERVASIVDATPRPFIILFSLGDRVLLSHQTASGSSCFSLPVLGLQAGNNYSVSTKSAAVARGASAPEPTTLRYWLIPPQRLSRPAAGRHLDSGSSRDAQTLLAGHCVREPGGSRCLPALHQPVAGRRRQTMAPSLETGWRGARRARMSRAAPSSPCRPSSADFRDLYTKVLEEEAASVSSADTGLCSEACLFRLARCPSPKLLRARSAEKRRPAPTFHKVPLPLGPAPAHSLGDLKGSWPGRGLVARFLQISKKSPDPTGPGAHGHKQVPRSPWGRPGRESLHLRSCGDLSSGSSLRRLLSSRRLEPTARPHSLTLGLGGGSRETGL